jgi:hypothetical protein
VAPPTEKPQQAAAWPPEAFHLEPPGGSGVASTGAYRVSPRSAVVDGAALRNQAGIERGRTGGVLAHANGTNGLSLLQIATVGARFPGCLMQGSCGRRERRSANPAGACVEPVRRVDVGGVVGGSPLRRRQEPDRARRRIGNGDGEVASGLPVASTSVEYDCC